MTVPATGIEPASRTYPERRSLYPDFGVTPEWRQWTLDGLKHARGAAAAFSDGKSRWNDAHVYVGAEAGRGLALAQRDAAAIGKFDESVHLAPMALEHIFRAFGETGRQPAGITHGLVLLCLHSLG